MVKSPIKIIDSGTAPTTENLGEGQIAFGTVDGATKLYGSDGTTVSELVGGSGQGPQGPAGEDGITPTIGDNGNWFLGETDTGKPSRGEQGPQGEPGQAGTPGAAGAPGAAATITVGTTTTGEAGTEASVTNSGTTSAAVLNFTIPKGAKGDKGDKGETGDTGPAGTTTFAGLTDQPTDNAALKTALDAKADQTTVDSLTTTVNGKVSSVTAGEGISITGTATAPVVNGMIAVPDWANPVSLSPTSSGGDTFFCVDPVPNTGVISFEMARRGSIRINNTDPAAYNWVMAQDGQQCIFPVAAGDSLTIYFDLGGVPSTIKLFPYKLVEIS